MCIVRPADGILLKHHKNKNKNKSRITDNSNKNNNLVSKQQYCQRQRTVAFFGLQKFDLQIQDTKNNSLKQLSTTE
jgi:hypothetical protein